MKTRKQIIRDIKRDVRRAQKKRERLLNRLKYGYHKRIKASAHFSNKSYKKKQRKPGLSSGAPAEAPIENLETSQENTGT